MQIYPYKNQIYENLNQQHDRYNLFSDPEFPANNKSLYYTQAPPRGVVWRRPSQICDDPQFIVNGVSRFDLDQGYIGNCWFIAAVSMITQRPLIFRHLVPLQTFDPDKYNGLFHFRFWQFGRWYDVVVDDLLPCFEHDGRLVFCSNKTEPNEFWSCLFEKAYAKLSWSYEGLDAGQTTDALIDMTGGIEETFDLKELTDKHSFFDVIGKALSNDAMCGCSINADPNIKEAKLPNGLIRGHAYAITAVVTLNINGQTVKLVRCRNPWGNEAEWKGDFSDSDPIWQTLPSKDRENLGQRSKADGEFWIKYSDWVNNFESVQICNISPDTMVMSRSGNRWNCIQYDGEWIVGRSAGGCGKDYDKQKYWTNPQYLVKLDQPDSGSNECVLIVACMQKYTRQKRMQMNGGSAEEFIQVRLYRVNEQVDLSLFQNGNGEKLYPKDLERVGTSGAYINKREVTYQCRLPPGNYIIIPSTYDANKEAKFLLRIFTETNAEFVPMNIDKPDVDPNELEFRDGKGPEYDFGVKQWWEALPIEERERIEKMLGIAAVGTAAFCCCLQIISQLLEQNREHEEEE